MRGEEFTREQIEAMSQLLQDSANCLQAAAIAMEAVGLTQVRAHLSNLRNTLLPQVFRYCQRAQLDIAAETRDYALGAPSQGEKAVKKYQREKSRAGEGKAKRGRK